MATIEEILEANERPLAQVQANIKYKEILTPAVINFITFVNGELKLAKDEPGFSGLIQHLKLVVAGGAAFNHYIKRVEKMSVLETHDFDLRLYLDIPPSRNPLFSSDKKRVKQLEEWMTNICREIGKSFANFLNDYVGQTEIKQDMKDQNIKVDDFRMVDHGFLTTVEYLIKIPNETGFIDSLVDIVPHVHSKAIHYGKLDINKEVNFEQYEEKDHGGGQSRQGFFKSSLVYTQDKYGVYYVSLGFLVWDTVRMLNWMIDSKFFGFKKRRKNPDYDPTLKFERYMYKYKALLTAISKPELFMRCESADKFINTCNRTKQVCNVKGKKLNKKGEVIYEGVRKGVFPNDVYWYKELMKMDFSKLCKAVLEV